MIRLWQADGAQGRVWSGSCRLIRTTQALHPEKRDNLCSTIVKLAAVAAGVDSASKTAGANKAIASTIARAAMRRSCSRSTKALPAMLNSLATG